MPITRAQAETVLVGAAPTAGAGLVGGLLARIGYVVTGASPVAGLSDAITEGLLACGITPADVTNPTDADLANLPASSWRKFRDIAELRLLELASGGGGSTSAVKSIEFEDYSKDLSVATDEASSLLASKRAYVRMTWGYGGGKLTAGSVDYGFAQTDPRQTDVIYPWGNF
jgi:hypothetical protein